MQKVFLSYAWADKEYAARLASWLQGQGFDVWFDVELSAGQKIAEEIERQISASIALVVILTPEARESDWVQDEITWALSQKKPVVPLMLRPCKLPIRLIRVHAENVGRGQLPSLRLAYHLRSLTRTAASADPQPGADA